MPLGLAPPSRCEACPGHLVALSFSFAWRVFFDRHRGWRWGDSASLSTSLSLSLDSGEVRFWRPVLPLGRGQVWP